ncbi:MAG TPA: HlyD family secretion protein [Gammaproteobacteria bacterium]|jgi:multidrug resistance efflux pump|nr:HlyD family secretion protein [Gammaproteobacteria bacterium]
MEAILLGIYSFFVWLIFIKFKWLPWNTRSQVVVAIIPIVGLTTLILMLNVFAPSSADVRVIKYVVQVMPQVKGRVIEVPIEGNKLYKKGEVLFRIDPTPYELDVKSLEAQLAETEGQAKQLREQLKSTAGNTGSIKAQRELARLRVTQNQELVSTGAGSQFDLDKSQADLAQLDAQVTTALANEAQVRAQLAAIVGGDQASVAKIKADLAKSRWELEQTTTYAPADGYVINLQLRPGSMVVPFPVAPAMSFVEEDYQVIALYQQNELHQVAAGNEAEIALITKPGAIIKAHVDSIIWAQGQGQMQMSGVLPQTGTQPLPPGRFAVKLSIDPKDQDEFLAAGAMGQGAIYTEHMAAIHILRKVILRVGSYTNYLIPKLH